MQKNIKDMSYKKLFTEFPPATTQQWEEKIKKDLKGADYNKKLISKTIEEIKIRPYYREENIKNIEFTENIPGKYPYVRGIKTKNNDFDIKQDIFVESFGKAGKKALDITEKGVDSVGFFLCHKEKITQNDINTLLTDINPEKTTINFISGKLSEKILNLFINFAENKSLDKNKVKATFDFDPFGYKTITGDFYTARNKEKVFADLKNMVKTVENYPLIKIIGINGIWFANAGASATQELAFSLSSANEMLSEAEKKEINIKKLIPEIHFNFGIGSNYFIEIAKLRAARLLWAKICEAWTSDKETGKMYINSITSDRNKTIYDPYVNQLRNTTEAMSAILGGTNALTVKPFDIIYKKTDDFSERIARNTGIILKEEAYFNKPVDIASGSYFIENLTNDIIEKSWEIFLKIEELGGYNQALKQNYIQNQIKKTAEKRKLNTATRKEILLGTNQYPNPNEEIKDSIDFNVYSWSLPENKNPETEPIKFFRSAKELEELRLATEKSNKKPVVFLLTHGNLAMRKARAAFASNFFACAGYKIIDNLGFKTPENGINAALKANADIVVICSSDDEYPSIVPEIYSKLKDRAITVVAGYPKEHIEKLKSQGIEHFIHIKSNIYETLKNFNKILKI